MILYPRVIPVARENTVVSCYYYFSLSSLAVPSRPHSLRHRESVELTSSPNMSPPQSSTHHASYVLSKHDDFLDSFVARLSSTLRQPNTNPQKLADCAIDLFHEPALSSTPFKIKQDLLGHVFQKTLLSELKKFRSQFSERTDHHKASDPGSDEQLAFRLKAFDSVFSLIDASIHLLSLPKYRDIISSRLPPQLVEFLLAMHSQVEIEARVHRIQSCFKEVRYVCSQMDDRAYYLYILKAINFCISRDKSGCYPLLSGHLKLMLAAAVPAWHPSCTKRLMAYNEDIEDVDIENLLKEHHQASVDTALYRAFWTAQNAMKNPSKAESPEEWKRIASCMERVIAAFRTVSPINTAEHEDIDDDVEMSANSDSKVGVKGEGKHLLKSMSKQSLQTESLSSPSILRLQMEDIRVRRQVLVQYAIFLHHLEVVSSQKPTERDSSATLKAIEHCKLLFSPGGSGMRLKKQVFDVMNSDTDGKLKRFVNNLLQRERCWINLKKTTGYSHLTKTKAKASKIFKRRKVGSKPVGKSSSSLKNRNDGGGLNGWKTRQRAWMLPSPSEREEILRDRANSELWSKDVLNMELKEDMNDEDVTEDTKRKNDSKYVWRTLRMLCEEDVTCLTRISGKKGAIDLEALVTAPKQSLSDPVAKVEPRI